MSVTMVLSLNGSEVGRIEYISFTADMNVQRAMELAYGMTPGHTYEVREEADASGFPYAM
jgi:hypothetical protein